MIQKITDLIFETMASGYQDNPWYFITITVITLTIVILQLYKNWIFAAGKILLTHKLNLVIFSLYFILETSVAFHDPSQATVILMNIVNIWALAMNLKGIYRIKNREANEHD